MKSERRETNTSILSIHDWIEKLSGCTSIEGKEFDLQRARTSLEEYPQSIRLGITRPDTVAFPPIHEQHVVDTCWAGWMPSDFKESVTEWLELVEKAKVLGPFQFSLFKKAIGNGYKALRTAVFIRAEII